MHNCAANPATLTKQEKKKMSITKTLPISIDVALDSLREDEMLVDYLGRNIVNVYLSVKEAEHVLLESISSKDKRHWFIARY